MFKDMDSMVNQFFGNLPKSYVAHCDYIAATIAGNLKANDLEGLISSVDRPKMDLGSDGALRSTKKTIEVVDRNGTRYRVTVEEV